MCGVAFMLDRLSNNNTTALRIDKCGAKIVRPTALIRGRVSNEKKVGRGKARKSNKKMRFPFYLFSSATYKRASVARSELRSRVTLTNEKNRNEA